MTIRSYRNKGLRRFAETGDASKLSVRHVERVRRILDLLVIARQPRDMDLPGLRFHFNKQWEGGRFAVWVSGNYRITFAWRDGAAEDVDLEDYH
jgi:proteic killer suppression protein